MIELTDIKLEFDKELHKKLDEYVSNGTKVTIQRKYLEPTAGDGFKNMDDYLTGIISKYMGEYSFHEILKGQTQLGQFIKSKHYDKVELVLDGGYKRRVRKSKRANKRMHKKQRTNRRKR